MILNYYSFLIHFIILFQKVYGKKKILDKKKASYSCFFDWHLYFTLKKQNKFGASVKKKKDVKKINKQALEKDKACYRKETWEMVEKKKKILCQQKHNGQCFFLFLFYVRKNSLLNAWRKKRALKNKRKLILFLFLMA